MEMVCVDENSAKKKQTKWRPSRKAVHIHNDDENDATDDDQDKNEEKDVKLVGIYAWLIS